MATAKVDPKFESNYVNMTFDNVELRWAKVQEHQFDQYQPPGMPAGEKKWVCDLMLNDKLGKSLEKEGFNIKKDKDGYFIHVSKKCENAKGQPNKPVVVVGLDGHTPVTQELGNGTQANVKVSAKKWPTVNTITVYLDAIQVVKLVEYNSVGGFENLSGDESPF